MSGFNKLYHVGDQVQVKNPLLKCHHGLNKNMQAMAGRIVTILQSFYGVKIALISMLLKRILILFRISLN